MVRTGDIQSKGILTQTAQPAFNGVSNTAQLNLVPGVTTTIFFQISFQEF